MNYHRSPGSTLKCALGRNPPFLGERTAAGEVSMAPGVLTGPFGSRMTFSCPVGQGELLGRPGIC